MEISQMTSWELRDALIAKLREEALERPKKHRRRFYTLKVVTAGKFKTSHGWTTFEMTEGAEEPVFTSK